MERGPSLFGFTGMVLSRTGRPLPEKNSSGILFLFIELIVFGDVGFPTLKDVGEVGGEGGYAFRAIPSLQSRPKPVRR